jgi:two-component system NtrC family sensor kinase
MKENGPVFPISDALSNERVLRLEAALRRSEKLAMAGRITASVMHEINNPTQAIADLIYLIQKDADRSDLVRSRAVQIEEQLVRIQYISRQTLSYFRDTPRRETKDLVPLVEAAIRYHSGLLVQKQIRTRKDLPDTMVGLIYPGDFLQLVSNLVRNAAEALPIGGTLSLRLRACGEDGRLTVADNGRGIPLTMRARLFEAFQSSKADAGNGLGLWICKSIVDKHGGCIRWRSCTEGRVHGTTFTISIPLGGQPAGAAVGLSSSYAVG